MLTLYDQGIIQKKYGCIGFLQSKKGTCQSHIKDQLGVWGSTVSPPVGPGQGPGGHSGGKAPENL